MGIGEAKRYRDQQKMLFSVSLFYPHIRFVICYRLSWCHKEVIAVKEKRKHIYLDDFEHRLLIGCLMAARNGYLREGKPTENANGLILKITKAPSKKLRVIKREGA